ncbi:hypothetical protein OROHE_022768 [Orobanche hederae]
MGKLIHISQAAMGEVNDVKAAKNVHLRMKINDQNFIIGSLAAGEKTQVMFDLFFEEFDFSHDVKNDSKVKEFSDFDDESEDEEEQIAARPRENGTTKAKPADVKPAAAAKGRKEEKVALKVEEDSYSDKDDSDDEMALDVMQVDSSDASGVCPRTHFSWTNWWFIYVYDSDDDKDDDSSSEEEELPKANLQEETDCIG